MRERRIDDLYYEAHERGLKLAEECREKNRCHNQPDWDLLTYVRILEAEMRKDENSEMASL